MSTRPKIIAAIFSAAALSLSACGTSVTEVANDDQAPVGNATPAASPKQAKASGSVVEMDKVRDLAVAGDTLAVHLDQSLRLGSVSKDQFEQQHTVAVDAACGHLTASTSSFLLSCPDGVHEIDARTGKDSKLDLEHPGSSAVKLSSQTVITASDQGDQVWIYRDGEQPASVKVEKNTDQMIRVPVDGQGDAVVRINRQYSVIQDVQWQDNKQGPILRVGSGVGQIAPGEHGVLLASDTVGNQLALYSAEEIIRLHQTIPTGPSPWAVAWDSQRQLAWVATTGDNKITGFSPKTGTMERTKEFASLPDATSMVVMPNGTIVAGSSSGAGLQILSD